MKLLSANHSSSCIVKSLKWKKLHDYIHKNYIIFFHFIFIFDKFFFFICKYIIKFFVLLLYLIRSRSVQYIKCQIESRHGEISMMHFFNRTLILHWECIVQKLLYNWAFTNFGSTHNNNFMPYICCNYCLFRFMLVDPLEEVKRLIWNEFHMKYTYSTFKYTYTYV